MDHVGQRRCRWLMEMGVETMLRGVKARTMLWEMLGEVLWLRCFRPGNSPLISFHCLNCHTSRPHAYLASRVTPHTLVSHLTPRTSLWPRATHMPNLSPLLCAQPACLTVPTIGVRVSFVLLTDLKLTSCCFRSHSVDFASLRSPRYHRAPVGLKTLRSVCRLLASCLTHHHYSLLYIKVVLSLLQIALLTSSYSHLS